MHCATKGVIADNRSHGGHDERGTVHGPPMPPGGGRKSAVFGRARGGARGGKRGGGKLLIFDEIFSAPWGGTQTPASRWQGPGGGVTGNP